MLRKINFRNIFKRQTTSSSVVKTAEDAAQNNDQPADFDPYLQPQDPLPSDTTDESVLAVEQKAFEASASVVSKAVAQQPAANKKDFKIDAFDGPAEDEGPVMPVTKKKPWWLVFITDVFNGCVLASCIVLTSALLGESYLQHNYPLLAFVAFIPFGIALLNIKSAFLSWFYGVATGSFFYLIILYWIYPTVQAGTQEAVLAGGAVTGLSIILSLQFGLFSLTVHFLKKVKWLFPLTAACAWVAWELAHQFIAYKYMGFPWFVLGYTQYANQPLIQISSITGAYGVSFAIAFFGFSMAYIAGKRCSFARIIYFVLPVALLILFYSYGVRTIKTYESLVQSNPQKLSVALMQTDTHATLLTGYNEDVTYMIAEQVQDLNGKKVNLIVWPESSYPGSFQDEAYSSFLMRVSARTGAKQISGSYEQEANGQAYVSAGLFDETGFKDSYHKTKLVPFGEFLPFRTLLKPLYTQYNITSLTGDFTEGKDPGKVLYFTFDDEQGRTKTFTIGTQICFESIFPVIWRKQALNGAQFFVNLSNDGWFLDTAAPYQHLRVNVFRAVENRRPVLRSTTTGVSGWVDSLGKIKFQTQLDKQETVLLNFYFQPRTAKTFYTLYGDIFAYICAAITLTIFIFTIVFINSKDSD